MSQHSTSTSSRDIEIPRICRALKTKGLYLDGLDDPDMQTSGPEARYWCLHSMQSFGPDGEYVCPEDCNPARSCFHE